MSLKEGLSSEERYSVITYPKLRMKGFKQKNKLELNGKVGHLLVLVFWTVD